MAATETISSVLITSEELAERIAALGAQITADYQGRSLQVICVLKGSSLFTADLVRHVDLPLTLDFIGTSSYGESTESSGVVRIVKDVEDSLEGKDVLIIEDIVDTGLTLSYLLETLRLRRPASLKVCALLDKPSRRKVEVPIDYLGFSIDDHFVIGYGLDYASRYRNLGYIGVLSLSE